MAIQEILSMDFNLIQSTHINNEKIENLYCSNTRDIQETVPADCLRGTSLQVVDVQGSSSWSFLGSRDWLVPFFYFTLIKTNKDCNFHRSRQIAVPVSVAAVGWVGSRLRGMKVLHRRSVRIRMTWIVFIENFAMY